MPIVRRSKTDINEAALLADLAARPAWTDARIDTMAAEDRDAWTEEDAASAVAVCPPPTAEQVRALRTRLGLSQAQFALRFGFTVDTVQQYEQGRRTPYEQGRRTPSGPASTLLRVIDADPDAVIRALRVRPSGSLAGRGI
jgi:putative transcriptional regulator